MVMVVAGCLLVLGIASESFAVKYRYRYCDEKGEAFFVDDLQQVPEKYRSRAMIVSTEEIDEQVHQAVEQERSRSAAEVEASSRARERAEQQAAVAQAQTGKEKRLPVGWAVGAASFLVVAIIVLPMIDALRVHSRAVESARSVLALLLLAVLVISFGKDVLRLFRAAGETVTGMQRQSAERGKKAAQFYKDMEKLAEQAESIQKEQETQVKALEEHL